MLTLITATVQGAVPKLTREGLPADPISIFKPYNKWLVTGCQLLSTGGMNADDPVVKNTLTELLRNKLLNTLSKENLTLADYANKLPNKYREKSKWVYDISIRGGRTFQELPPK